jgi:hypothetical protein
MTGELRSKTHKSVRRSIERVEPQGEPATRLSGPELLLARLLWAVVTVLAVGVFFAKISVLYTVLGHPSAPTQALMDQLGISPTFRAAYVIGVESIAAVVFFAVAIALARFKSDHPPALLASTALLAFGASGATLNVLTQVDPRWALPVAVLGFLYRTTFVIFLYIFPDGRFVPRWTKFASACWIAIALLVVMPAWVPLSAERWPAPIGLPIELLLLGTVVYAQVFRYRHVSDLRQRRQTRWVVFGVAVAISLSFVAELPRFIFPSLNQPSVAALLYELIFLGLWDLPLVLIPLTVGIAIFRHQLYDIDVVINRTLVYGLLTAVMAGLFAGTVKLVEKLLLSFTGQKSDQALVLATLVIVAAFTPVKNGLQELVDKRFKEPPDPLRQLKAFGEQVRFRLAPLDAHQVMRRLLNVTVTAFDATGGAIYLQLDEPAQPIVTVGEWNGEATLHLPIADGDRQLGMLALGARRNGRQYSSQERKALKQVTQEVAQAAEEDRQSQ